MNEYIYPSSVPFTSDIRVQDDIREIRDAPALRLPHLSPLLEGVQSLFLAAAAITAPHVYIAEMPILRRSVSSAVIWGIPRKGRKISLREARQIALRILAETERELLEERSAEARFLLSAWEDRHNESQ